MSRSSQVQEAIDFQAEELLYYKKMQMQNAVAKRTKERVAKIANQRTYATTPNSSHAYAEQLAAREVLQHQHGHVQKPKVLSRHRTLEPSQLRSMQTSAFPAHKSTNKTGSAVSPCAHAHNTVQPRPECKPTPESLFAPRISGAKRSQSKPQNVSPVPAVAGTGPFKRPSSTTSRNPIPDKRASPERATGLQPPEPPIPTATYVPYAHQVPHAHAPRIPQTIVSEWHRLTSVPLGAMPNTPPCMCARCPFTYGPPLQRRYNLLLAMINLENYLIGM